MRQLFYLPAEPAFDICVPMIKPAPLTAKVVVCPACQGKSMYAPDNPFRPFCSERCKNIDLGAWASESFRVAADVPPDDQVGGDPALQ